MAYSIFIGYYKLYSKYGGLVSTAPPSFKLTAGGIGLECTVTAKLLVVLNGNNYLHIALAVAPVGTINGSIYLTNYRPTVSVRITDLLPGGVTIIGSSNEIVSSTPSTYSVPLQLLAPIVAWPLRAPDAGASSTDQVTLQFHARDVPTSIWRAVPPHSYPLPPLAPVEVPVLVRAD